MSHAKTFHSKDDERQLFTFKSGEGYTCWGYQNAIDETAQLQTVMEEPVLAFQPGDIRVLSEHDRLLEQLQRAGGYPKTWFNRNTPEKVRWALERARINCWTVRLWLGDSTTGKPWLEEHGVVGRIRRSGGLLKVPILIERGGDGLGGGAILDNCVVRVEQWSPRPMKCMDVLYSHELFRYPSAEVVKGKEDGKAKPRTIYSVMVDQQLYGIEYSRPEANRLAAFMRGEIIW